MLRKHVGHHNTLHSTSTAASLAPSREVRFWSDRRPADIFLPYWSGRRFTAWDAASTPDYVASKAYKRNIMEAAEECKRQGIELIPLAVEVGER